MDYSESTICQLEQVLLRHDLRGIETVILIPLRSIYSRVVSLWNTSAKAYQGFYNNTIVDLENGKKIVIINIPQGIQAQDIFSILLKKRVLFFGYAGSLNEMYGIGTVWEIEDAIRSDGSKSTLVRTHMFPSVTGGYSPCMLGDLADYHCEMARKNQCDIVDMEIAYCAAAAEVNDNTFSAWALITDIPGLINFWEVPPEMQADMQNGVERVLATIKEFCK